jgi:hypothetical protein
MAQRSELKNNRYRVLMSWEPLPLDSRISEFRWQAVAAERYPQIARFVSPARGDEVPLDVSLLRPECDESTERAQYDCRVVAAET